VILIVSSVLGLGAQASKLLHVDFMMGRN